MLEGRLLLSQSFIRMPAEVSVLAKPKAKSISVTGTISGTTGLTFANTSSYTDPVQYIDASGNLPFLGLVQMTTSVRDVGHRKNRGTMALTSSAGTLTLGVVEKTKGPLSLTVDNGTGAYAGYSGSGTLKVVITDPGYRHIFTTNNTLKLKLKT
jgi:hypothetical protein